MGSRNIASWFLLSPSAMPYWVFLSCFWHKWHLIFAGQSSNTAWIPCLFWGTEQKRPRPARRSAPNKPGYSIAATGAASLQHIRSVSWNSSCRNPANIIFAPSPRIPLLAACRHSAWQLEICLSIFPFVIIIHVFPKIYHHSRNYSHIIILMNYCRRSSPASSSCAQV